MKMSRKEYWIKYIAAMIVVAMIIVMQVGLIYAFSEVGLYFIPIAGILILGISILQLVWMVRRLHDVGLSGVWVLLGFLPAIGGLAVLIMALLPADSFDMWVE